MKDGKKAIHRIISMLLAVFVAVSLCACSFIIEAEEHTVTYVCNNGEEPKTKTVTANSVHTAPLAPEKENYIFRGWYEDEDLQTEYQFGKILTEDITLYAAWDLDFEKTTNSLTTEYMKANLKIRSVYMKNGFFGASPTGDGATGSGVIFNLRDGFYYALTNYHVIDYPDSADFSEYTVIDAFGNEYEGEVVKKNSAYDLAIIKFSKGEEELRVLEIDDRIPCEEEVIVAIGQPKGQFNAITYGKIIDYEEIASETEEETLKKVEFEVLWHTAYLNRGSSGGALLSADLKIIGINYASSTKEGGVFQYGFAIPAAKVLEFLGSYANTAPVSN